MALFDNKNYYEILGIDKKATPQQIKKAFYAQSRKYHPDVNKASDAEENFKKINEAYQTLIDDQERKKYDSFLNSDNKKQNYQQYQNSSFYDVTVLDKFMHNENASLNELKVLLDGCSDEIKIYLYEYFWLSLWAGKYSTEQLLIFSRASQIFKMFNDYSCIKNSYTQISSMLKGENKKIFKQIEDAYTQSISFILTELSQDVESVHKYNYMVEVLTEENVFDNEVAPYIASKHFQDTLRLLRIFENIETSSRSYSNAYNRTSKDDKMSKKMVATTTSGVSAVVIIIILIVIFMVFR